MARVSTLGPEFAPRGRGEVILISLPDKEKSELPSTFAQLGYCPTPWAAIHILIMQIAPLGVAQYITCAAVPGDSG